MPQRPSRFAELLGRTRRYALHLETRDAYAVAGESPRFDAWLAGERTDWEDRDSWWGNWHTMVQEATDRGVAVRRARVIGEPVSDYIRWEHSITYGNIACGEDVRWLPRRQASDLALPGNDVWIFDDEIIQFNVFDGNNRWAHTDFDEDAAVVARCTAMFEAVWARAVPHNEYKIV